MRDRRQGDCGFPSRKHHPTVTACIWQATHLLTPPSSTPHSTILHATPVILHACGGCVFAIGSALKSPRSKTDGPHAWAMTGEGRRKRLTLFLVCDLCALMVQARRDQCRELIYTA